MSESGLTYVTEAMRTAQGAWTGERTAPPITETDIRRWAMATYYPEQPPRIYWDAEYAATTQWGGGVAPPGFNPFAWPPERLRPAAPGLMGARPDDKSLTGMNGGQTDTYGVPMRAGDVVSERRRLVDWWEREGRPGAHPVRAQRDRMAQPARRSGPHAPVHRHSLPVNVLNQDGFATCPGHAVIVLP